MSCVKKDQINERMVVFDDNIVELEVDFDKLKLLSEVHSTVYFTKKFFLYYTSIS